MKAKQTLVTLCIDPAIEHQLKPSGGGVITLTVGNGKEFSYHQQLKTLVIQTYFADPYCSWQRGINENFNGLLTQYILKKRPMDTVTEEDLTMIENILNHQPRKRQRFKTSHEVLHVAFTRVALHPRIRQSIHCQK